MNLLRVVPWVLTAAAALVACAEEAPPTRGMPVRNPARPDDTEDSEESPPPFQPLETCFPADYTTQVSTNSLLLLCAGELVRLGLDEKGSIKERVTLWDLSLSNYPAGTSASARYLALSEDESRAYVALHLSPGVVNFLVLDSQTGEVLQEESFPHMYMFGIFVYDHSLLIARSAIGLGLVPEFIFYRVPLDEEQLLVVPEDLHNLEYLDELRAFSVEGYETPVTVKPLFEGLFGVYYHRYPGDLSWWGSITNGLMLFRLGEAEPVDWIEAPPHEEGSWAPDVPNKKGAMAVDADRKKVFIKRYTGVSGIDEIVEFDLEARTSNLLPALPIGDLSPEAIEAGSVNVNNITQLTTDPSGILIASHTRESALYFLDPSSGDLIQSVSVDDRCPHAPLEDLRRDCLLGASGILSNRFYQVVGRPWSNLRLFSTDLP